LRGTLRSNPALGLAPKLIECDDDQKATQQAAQTEDGYEVWCGERRIAILPSK
jgi:hypothetical protein